MRKVIGGGWKSVAKGLDDGDDMRYNKIKPFFSLLTSSFLLLSAEGCCRVCGRRLFALPGPVKAARQHPDNLN